MFALSLSLSLLALQFPFGRCQTAHTFQYERRCAHNEISRGPVDTSNVPYDNHPFQQPPAAAPATFSSIRIKPYYDFLSSDLSDNAAQTHARQMIETAIVYVTQSIKVVSVSPVLRFDQTCESIVNGQPGKCTAFSNTCNDDLSGLRTQIPSDHLRGAARYNSNGAVMETVPSGGGISNADLVLYIRSDGAACGTEATVPSTGRMMSFTKVNTWGAACRRDQYGRPTAGYMNLCPEYLRRTQDFRVSIKEIVHQFYHILGFSESLFDGFRRPDGSVRPLSETMQTNVDFGPGFTNRYPAIVTPLVVDFVRSYFNCNTMPGAALETFNEMEEGIARAARPFSYTSSSHWHTRFFFTEMMNPRIWTQRTFTSGLTLRLLADSNWYQVAYNEFAEPMRWAYRMGCSLNLGPNRNQASITETCDPDFNLYCYELCTHNPSCTYDGFSQARCPTARIGTFSCERSGFDGGIAVAGAGGDPMQNTRQSDWAFACADDRTNPSAPNEFFRGSQAGFIQATGQRNSRCLTHTSFSVSFGSCSLISCSGYDAATGQWDRMTATLTRLSTAGPISSEFPCTNDRQNAAVQCQSFNGPVPELAGYTCPPVDNYCVTSRPFECRFGWWSELLGRCICSAGMMDGARCDSESRRTIPPLQVATEAPASSLVDPPTRSPVRRATFDPSTGPTDQPTVAAPFRRPATGSPVTKPSSASPSARPSARPTPKPTPKPSPQPTEEPTGRPVSVSNSPTQRPTQRPTPRPSLNPVRQVTTPRPTSTTTARPTAQNPIPTPLPTSNPTLRPTGSLNPNPSPAPTKLLGNQPSSRSDSNGSNDGSGSSDEEKRKGKSRSKSGSKSGSKGKSRGSGGKNKNVGNDSKGSGSGGSKGSNKQGRGSGGFIPAKRDRNDSGENKGKKNRSGSNKRGSGNNPYSGGKGSRPGRNRNSRDQSQGGW